MIVNLPLKSLISEQTFEGKTYYTETIFSSAGKVTDVPGSRKILGYD